MTVEAGDSTSRNYCVVRKREKEREREGGREGRRHVLLLLLLLLLLSQYESCLQYKLG